MLHNVTVTDFWTSIVPPSSGSMKMETPSSSRRSVSIYMSTWCNIPEDLNHLTGFSHNFIYHLRYIGYISFTFSSTFTSMVSFPEGENRLWSNCTTNCRKHLFFCTYHCLWLCDPQVYLLTNTKSAKSWRESCPCQSHEGIWREQRYSSIHS